MDTTTCVLNNRPRLIYPAMSFLDAIMTWLNLKVFVGAFFLSCHLTGWVSLITNYDNPYRGVTVGGHCVQMDFMWTFGANTKCNNINYQILVVLKYHRRLWYSIFDTDISRSISIPKKAKYTPLMWEFMHLKMSVSKILFHRRLWYFRTTKTW